MGAELTVLGAGSILPRAGYGCAGYALRPEPGGPVTLLDCGPGSVRALGAAGIGLEEVRRVLISHFHPDHCLDLLALAFARRNPAFDPAPALELVGPRGLEALLGRARDLFGGWVRDDRATVRELAPGRHAAGELELACVPTGHTPEALAWRVETPAGACLTYTGDTGEVPAVADLAAGCDLFVVECSFPDEAPVELHLTPSSAGRLAARAGCARLLLTHFYPEMDPEQARRGAAAHFAGPIDLAADGSRHVFGDEASNPGARPGTMSG